MNGLNHCQDPVTHTRTHTQLCIIQVTLSVISRCSDPKYVCVCVCIVAKGQNLNGTVHPITFTGHLTKHHCHTLFENIVLRRTKTILVIFITSQTYLQIGNKIRYGQSSEM